MGQGITLGNALRRALLGDLTGVAASSANIVGAVHEFSTLQGVRESVLEILLNLKQIVFKKIGLRPKNPEEGEVIAELDVQGPATVLANDLMVPNWVKIVDPSQYIATISTDVKLKLQIYLSEGTGYRMKRAALAPPTFAADETQASITDGRMKLHIDALFLPVTRVNYRVEENMVQGRRQEQLMLEIWTNGSISPRQALDQAAVTLIRTLGSLQAPPRGLVARLPASQAPSDESAYVLRSIESLELSVRSSNCLKRANINTVGELISFSREDLLQLKNFGTKSANEVVQVLAERMGLTLRGESLASLNVPATTEDITEVTVSKKAMKKRRKRSS
jgi:DNA-directed RNA polymerase subunit alpha